MCEQEKWRKHVLVLEYIDILCIKRNQHFHKLCSCQIIYISYRDGCFIQLCFLFLLRVVTWSYQFMKYTCASCVYICRANTDDLSSFKIRQKLNLNHWKENFKNYFVMLEKWHNHEDHNCWHDCKMVTQSKKTFCVLKLYSTKSGLLLSGAFRWSSIKMLCIWMQFASFYSVSLAIDQTRVPLVTTNVFMVSGWLECSFWR